MNIAIFTHNYPKNKNDRKDAGIFIHDFAEKLKRYHKVFIFSPDYGNNEKFGNWSLFNPLSVYKFFRNIFFGTSEALKFVKKNKIGYVLSAWAIPSGIYSFVVKLKLKIPYGVWYLGSDLNIYAKIPVLSQIIYFISKYADNRFANSYALTKISEKKYGKTIMLPASTEVDEKTLKIDKNIKKFDRKKVNILYVGRLEKVKGPDLLVEAAKKLGDKFVVRIVGSGTMFSRLENKSENIRLLGYLGLEETTSYMRRSDFLIVPSRNESLPLVILEAANYNLPVLASNVGDCKYVLKKYNLGSTFERGNIEQMISKIKKFNYKYFRKKGKFSRMVLDYSLNSSVEKFLKNI